MIAGSRRRRVTVPRRAARDVRVPVGRRVVLWLLDLALAGASSATAAPEASVSPSPLVDGAFAPVDGLRRRLRRRRVPVDVRSPDPSSCASPAPSPRPSGAASPEVSAAPSSLRDCSPSSESGLGFGAGLRAGDFRGPRLRVAPCLEPCLVAFGAGSSLGASVAVASAAGDSVPESELVELELVGLELELVDPLEPPRPRPLPPRRRRRGLGRGSSDPSPACEAGESRASSVIP
jgi:hypothetical protein